MLSPREKQQIIICFPHYSSRQALCVEALKVVQRQRGQVPDACIQDIAKLLDVAPQALFSVMSCCLGIRRG